MKEDQEIEGIVNGVVKILEDRKKEYLVDVVAKRVMKKATKVGVKRKKQFLEKIARVLNDKAKTINQATIVTPVKLGASEKVKTKKLVTKLTKGKVKNFMFAVDSGLIDGMKILYADRVWDMSMAGRLAHFRRMVES